MDSAKQIFNECVNVYKADLGLNPDFPTFLLYAIVSLLILSESPFHHLWNGDNNNDLSQIS